MFNPWIGSTWKVPMNAMGGIGLLILGESHYTKQDELVGECLPDTTIDTVQELAVEGSHRFFTGLLQTILGRRKRDLNSEEVGAFWKSVAFYNYVPVFVATQPRVRPSAAMFKSGLPPFEKVMSDLMPDAILVCGRDLWWWLTNGKSSTTRICRIGPVAAARIMHPSATGFSSVKEHPVVEQLLEAVRNQN